MTQQKIKDDNRQSMLYLERHGVTAENEQELITNLINELDAKLEQQQ